MAQKAETDENTFERFMAVHQNEEESLNTGETESLIPSNIAESDFSQLLRTLNATIQQNAQIMNLLQISQGRQTRTSEIATDIKKYHVMPDLSKSIANFTGEGNLNLGKKWLDQLKNTAALHNWPEAFILQTAQNHLVGAARHWWEGRSEELYDWRTFERAFRKTFIFEENRNDLWNRMQRRIQKPNETLGAYYQEKVAMCRTLNLPFRETKEQIAIGLLCNNTADFVLSKLHVDEDDLFQDIINYERINQARKDTIKARPDVTRMTEAKGSRESSARTTNPIVREQPRCYNCNKVGHIATNCLNPRRPKGSCFECGATDHRVSACPTRRVSGPRQVQTEDRRAMVITGSQPMMVTIELGLDGRVLALDALVDTGSSISLIRYSSVKHIKLESRQDIGNFEGINKTKLEILGEINSIVSINDIQLEVLFFVVPDITIPYDCLLGRNFICNPNVEISFQDNSVNIKPSRTYLDYTNECQQILNINCVEDKTNSEYDIDVDTTLPLHVLLSLREIFQKFYLNATRPETPEIDFRMQLVVNKLEPFYFRPRRLSYSERQALDKILEDLLERKIIRESDSPYCSPIVLTTKKTGEYRMCVDFRTLNKYLARDQFPLPLIDDHLDQLKNKKYFTRLDLKNAFYHIALDEQSIKYTSFITPTGQYEFCRMPFGLSSSPATFSRFINKAFKELIQSNKVQIYIDDILIATKTINENLDILKEVFRILTDNLLELRIDKCSFLKTKIDFLGYSIDKNGVSPNEMNIETVKKYPVPTNAKEVHRFIGLCSYFRRFIQNFSLIAKPLYDLLKKDVKFEFDEKQMESFENLKSKLMSRPVLAIYSPHCETELHCDASRHGFGSILLQKQSDKKLHPVFFFSKRTSEHETKYHSYELECLSIIYALKRFHTYLQGIPFKIVTDCDSFRLTLAKKDVVPRIMRWCLLLQNYQYTIEHRSNIRMQHVDALSRINHVLILEGNTLEQTLAYKQTTEGDIVKLREALEKSEHPLYELRNGLVYRKHGDQILFYVPPCMEVNVIYTYHNEMGHYGVDKTLELITRTYWFPKIRSKIREFISNCLKCVEFNRKSGKQEGYLHSIPKGNLPFDTVHIDHYGPLPTTRRKRKYVFEIVDGFTKFIKIYPCKTAGAQEVIKHLRSYVKNYSRPRIIISDRGSCFTSNLFEEFCNGNEMKHILIAAGTPRANGQIERMNSIITPMLSKLVDQNEREWDDLLADVEFGMNNTVNRATGETPSKLLFGRNQLGNVHDNIRETLETIIQDQVRDLEEIRANAGKRIMENQTKNEKYYNQRRRESCQYESGQAVMISNVDTTPGTNKKLIPKYRGPYQVKAILPNDRYLISDLPGFQNTQIPYESVLHASRLKPYESN